jgi:putative ABC transport system permease protein
VDRILATLLATPGITDAALTSAFPIAEMPTMVVSTERIETAARMASVDAPVMIVSPGFFRVLSVPITEGRGFADADDRTRPPVAIVSRTLARRLWPDGGAVGRRLALGSGPAARAATVVGVAGDTDTVAGDHRPQPALFLPVSQQPPAAVAVALKSRDSARALAAVEAAVRAVDADIPVYEPAPLSETQLAALGPRLLAVTLLGGFGAAVLALSSLGIYAVVSQSVQERAQELRIRLTFGAEPRRLFVDEMRRVARLVTFSAAAGFAGAIGALRLLGATWAGFAGSAMKPLGTSTAILIVLALVATAIPAYRACRLETLNR